MPRKFCRVDGVAELDTQDLHLIDEKLELLNLTTDCQVKAMTCASDERNVHPRDDCLVGRTVDSNDEHEHVDALSVQLQHRLNHFKMCLSGLA